MEHHTTARLKTGALTDADVQLGWKISILLSEHLWPDNARALHIGAIELLRKTLPNEAVIKEYSTLSLGDEVNGRIDLVILGAGRVAIEFDARRPRARSLLKLSLFEGYRIVGLRGVSASSGSIADEVIPLRVHAVRRTF